MSKHTPGPWTTCQSGQCSCGLIWSMPADQPVFTAGLEGESHRVVGLANAEWGDGPDFVYGAISKEQQTANSLLIAAAPELLDALQSALAALSDELAEGCERAPAIRPVVEQARAAIAKATSSTLTPDELYDLSGGGK